MNPQYIPSRREIVGEDEYARVHMWLRYYYEKADRCESNICPGKSKNYSYALKKECKYEKKRENFMMLCRQCHFYYDWQEHTSDNMRLSSQKLKQTHCKRGHEFDKENTIMRHQGKWRKCRACEKLTHSKEFMEYKKLTGHFPTNNK